MFNSVLLNKKAQWGYLCHPLSNSSFDLGSGIIYGLSSQGRTVFHEVGMNYKCIVYIFVNISLDENMHAYIKNLALSKIYILVKSIF